MRLSDPDFHVTRQNSSTFGNYLDDLNDEDYPAALIHGYCPVPHTKAAGLTAVPGGQPAGALADLVMWTARLPSEDDIRGG